MARTKRTVEQIQAESMDCAIEEFEFQQQTTNWEETTMSNANILREGFANNPNANLRRLAEQTGLKYDRLLFHARKPIAGQVYDPNVYNFDLLAKIIPEESIQAIDWEKMNEPNVRMIKERATRDISAYPAGCLFTTRRDKRANNWALIHKTDTHVVVLCDGVTKPQVWGHDMFLAETPKVVVQEQEA